MAAISTFRLILSLALVNGIGFTLRYFGYDTFIIIAGFRFHLSFILPLLVLFPSGVADAAIKVLSRPDYKKKFLPLLWILLAPALIMASLYFSANLELADPDYFYEFGLSSVFDYPVYLIWNFPQLLLLYLYVDISVKNKKNKFIPSFLLIFFLFVYELIPVDLVFEDVMLYSACDFIIAVSCIAFLFSAYRNVYWFAVTVFSIFWFNLLAFGSGTAVLINMLFAAQYNSWEGFFVMDKDYSVYLLAAHLLITLFFLAAFLPFRKTGKKNDVTYEISDVKPDASL